MLRCKKHHVYRAGARVSPSCFLCTTTTRPVPFLFVRFLPEVIRRLFKLWTPRLDPLPINRLHRIGQFRRLLGSRLPRVRSGKEVRVGDHSRKELGSFRVDCERLCRGLTKQTPFFLARTPRDRHFVSLTNPIRGKRLDFTRGRILRGRPGSGEAPFCGLANLWTAFQTSSSNHSPMGIFSRIRRREKKKKYLRTQIPVRDY